MIYEQAFSVKSSLSGPTDTFTSLLVKHFTILFQANSIVPPKLIVFTMFPAKLFPTRPGSYFEAFFTRPVGVTTFRNNVKIT
jgi:hypothetical protein